jgi:2-methylcitrate dehydratase PrpD
MTPGSGTRMHTTRQLADYALDLDDGHRAAGGHPGAAVIPGVFAVARELGAEWPETLAALTAGYEVGVRIAAGRDVSRLDPLPGLLSPGLSSP